MKKTREKALTKYNFRKRNHSVREEVEAHLSSEKSVVCDALCTDRNVEKLKCAVESIKKENLKSDLTKKKTGMTDEILVMMERMRIVKNNPNEYKNINKEIRKAKEREIQGKIGNKRLTNKIGQFTEKLEKWWANTMQEL